MTPINDGRLQCFIMKGFGVVIQEMKREIQDTIKWHYVYRQTMLLRLGF